MCSSGRFADRAAAALQDERVSSRVAAKLTDEVVLASAADLLAARPLIEQAAEGVVRGAAFRQLFRAPVRDVHAAVFNRDLDTVTLTVADAGTVVAAAVEALQPAVAEKIPHDARITLVREQVDDGAADLAARRRGRPPARPRCWHCCRSRWPSPGSRGRLTGAARSGGSAPARRPPAC